MKAVVLNHGTLAFSATCDPTLSHRLATGEPVLDRLLRQLCLEGVDEILIAGQPDLVDDPAWTGKVRCASQGQLAQAMRETAARAGETGEAILVCSDHLVLTPRALVTLMGVPAQTNRIGAVSEVRDSAAEVRRHAEAGTGKRLPMNALVRVGRVERLVPESATIGTASILPAMVLTAEALERWGEQLAVQGASADPPGSLQAVFGEFETQLVQVGEELAGTFECGDTEDPLPGVDLRQQYLSIGWLGKLALGPAFRGAGVRDLMVLSDEGSLPAEVSSYLHSLGLVFSVLEPGRGVPTWADLADYWAECRKVSPQAILSFGPRSVNLGKWLSVTLTSAAPPSGLRDAVDGRRTPHFALVTGPDVVSAAHDIALVSVDDRLVQVQHQALLPDHYCADTALLKDAGRSVRAETVAAVLAACLATPLADPGNQRAAESFSAAKAAFGALYRWLRLDSGADAVVVKSARAAAGAMMASGTCQLPIVAERLAQQAGEPRGLALLRAIPDFLLSQEAYIASDADPADAVGLRRTIDNFCAALGVRGAEAGSRAVINLAQLLDADRLGHPWNDAEGSSTRRRGASLAAVLDGLQVTEEGALRGFSCALGPETDDAWLASELSATLLRSFDALLAFAQMAQRRKLTYFLFDQTLRDCVALKRLTPWTGPLTVAMPRSSYDKLVRWGDQLPATVELKEGSLAAGGRGSAEAFIQWRGTEGAGLRVRVLDEVKGGGAQSRGGRLRLRLVHAVALAEGPGSGGGILQRAVRAASRIIPQKTQVVPRKVVSRGLNQGARLDSYLLPGANRVFSKSVFPASWFGTGSKGSLFGHTFPIPKRAQSVLARSMGGRWSWTTDVAEGGAKSHLQWTEQLQHVAPSDKPMISIIVPVYNVEKYIDQCMESLCHQDDDTYEVIAVDDGSPDDSITHLRKFERLYPGFVRVVQKPNGGLSDARNFGLQHARGEYVAFVDSDDIVSTSMVREFRDKAMESGAEIVVCNLAELRDDGTALQYRWMSSKNSFGRSVHESPEVLIAAHPFAWNKLYKKSLFLDSGIRYPKGQAFEDSATTFNLMLLANKVEYVDSALYFYRVDRADSITNTFDQKFYDIFKSFESIRTFYSERGQLEVFREEVDEIFRRTSFARVGALEGVEDAEGVNRFVDAVYDYLEQYAPEWANNRYFVKQMRGQKYASSEKYLAMPNRERMKAFLASSRAAGKVEVASTDELVRELQMEGLDLVLRLDRLCSDLGLTYFLGEGTLLGAMRHQGFIPWDDDVDVVMPRRDYEKLLRHLEAQPDHGLRLLNERVFPRYHLSFSKVLSVDESDFITTHIDMPDDLVGPAVDIFPLDVATRRRDRRVEKRIRDLRDMLLFKVGFMSRKTIKAKYRLYLASKVHSFTYLQETIQKLYRRDEGNPDADQVVNYASSYPVNRERVPREAYGSAVRVPFEGHLLPVPEGWDAILATTYGAYTELPPPASRKPRHRPKVRSDRRAGARST